MDKVKCSINVIDEGHQQTIEADSTEMLLAALQLAGIEVYAPCGGNGTCGKCKVAVKGEGMVTACFYPVRDNITIRLPDKRAMQILVDQHRFTRKLPLNSGPASELSAYPFGIAIDIGTTSMVFYLVDLITGVVAGVRADVNPQGRFGSDVISRIDFATTKKDGLELLQKVLIDSINKQVRHFLSFAGIGADNIVKVTIAGNTTMLHLLLGIDPRSIALAPFTPTFLDRQQVSARKLGLQCHEKALIETLPGISAYVGADIVAGLASIAPGDSISKYLFMDIGTNGEIALVTSDGVICSATAAGPAFEGARISCGMMASEGAVAAFGAAGAKVIGDVPAMGICGSGLIDVVAYLRKHDLLDDEGLLQEDFVVVDAVRTGDGKPVVITQADIREVQLAKSAIASGVNILLHKAGLAPGELDAVFLAGGFGNYINTQSATEIGLLSPAFDDKIISLGNASGTGALMALKSLNFHEWTSSLIQKAKHLELAEEDDFALEFAMNMMFGQYIQLM